MSVGNGCLKSIAGGRTVVQARTPVRAGHASLTLLLLSLLLVAGAGAAPARAVAETKTTAGETAFLPLISRHELPHNIWLGEYYNNPNLAGEPVYTKEEKRIDHDWGEDNPDGLPENYFSMRWTGSWEFEVGVYTFIVFADDGARLWLDDVLLIDEWTAGMGEYDETVTIGTPGLHDLKIEYYERTGDAGVSVRWRRTDLYPRWEYSTHKNPWLEGTAYDRGTDLAIQEEWGEDCPDGLPCDSFSVEWDATPIFEKGSYRILLYADEGYRLWVDGDEVQDAGWYTSGGGAEDDWYDLYVDQTEYIELGYDFHDRGGMAEARLWMVRLDLPEWTVEYYGNTTLSGTPALTRQEEGIFYDWGLDKPHHSLPRDNFSARWSGQRYFHSGFYRFGLFADDGVRLWVDDELLVSAWRPGRGEHLSPLTYMSTGYHEVVVEYVEYSGEAEIRYWWE